MSRSGAGAQMEFRHSDREIEPDRAVHRNRLQRDGATGTANEHVGAEAGGDRYLASRAEIIAGENSRAGRGDAVREDSPYHHAAAGGANIEPKLADRSAVDVLRSRRLQVSPK
jgi:hypothetical protein